MNEKEKKLLKGKYWERTDENIEKFLHLHKPKDVFTMEDAIRWSMLISGSCRNGVLAFVEDLKINDKHLTAGEFLSLGCKARGEFGMRMRYAHFCLLHPWCKPLAKMRLYIEKKSNELKKPIRKILRFFIFTLKVVRERYDEFSNEENE